MIKVKISRCNSRQTDGRANTKTQQKVAGTSDNGIFWNSTDSLTRGENFVYNKKVGGDLLVFGLYFLSRSKQQGKHHNRIAKKREVARSYNIFII